MQDSQLRARSTFQERRVVATTPRTTPTFTTVAGIVALAATFLPLRSRVLLRLVCDRWRVAAADTVCKLKCGDRFTHPQLAQIVAAFPDLRSLDLSECEEPLSAAAFCGLRSLRRLEALVLRGSDVTDAILGEVSRLATLTSLDVANSGDTFTPAGLESLLRLPRLEMLGLSGCKQLGAEAFAVIAWLPALKSLTVARCIVSIMSLASICSMVRLTSLDLRRCGPLTAAHARQLARLPSLRALMFDYDGKEPACLAIVAGLASRPLSLALRCDDVVDSDVGKLLTVARMTELEVSSYNWLNDCSLATIGRFAWLEKLNLTWSVWLTDAGVGQLRGLKALKELRLSWCEFITDAALAVIAGLPLLETLDLHGGSLLGDRGLQSLAALKHLRWLDVSWARNITNAGVAAIARLPLHTLHLHGCESITDYGLAFVRGLRALCVLDLRECTLLTNAGLQHLRDMPSLQKICVFGCHRVTAEGKAPLVAEGMDI